jgi:steroid 5-alpha reductase family enzyme
VSSLSKDLLLPALVLFVYFSLWFIVASYKKRLDYVDIAWGGGFIAVVLTQFFRHWDTVNYVQATICVCVLIWGLRIMWHLGRRNFGKQTEDPRYTEIRKKWRNFQHLRSYVTIFMLQAGLVWMIGLPLDTIWRASFSSFGGISIGLGVWIIGFLFESVADRQLRKFSAKPSNKGKVLSSGLWRYSRHPNYFGELTQWWGIWLMCLYLHPVGWSIVGPLTITYLIRFVSGVPPIEKRHSKDAAYQKYKAKTAMLIPALPKVSRTT